MTESWVINTIIFILILIGGIGLLCILLYFLPDKWRPGVSAK